MYCKKLNFFTPGILLTNGDSVYSLLLNVRTKKSNFHSDTKSLLYVFAVISPFIGLILFFIKDRKNKHYSTQ